MGIEDNRQIILVTGGDGGYGNLGDEWLADSVRNRYKKIKQKYRVIFLMQCPKTDSDGFYYAFDDKESFEKMNIPIDRIKAVHFYGGGYMNDCWIDVKLWLYDYLIEKGMSGSNIFFTGVGLGPLNDDNLTRARKISKNVRFFGVRDRSFRFLFKKHFMFDESIVDSRFNQKNKKNKLLINFRMADHVGINEEIISTMLKQIYRSTALGNRGLDIAYFPMIDDVWFDEKKEIIKVLNVNKIAYDNVLDRPNNYGDLLKLVQPASIVVTTSYHVVLASLYAGTPVIAVYGNEYYHIKFTNLKKVLPTKLLEVVEASQFDESIIDKCIMARDDRLANRIKKLKSISDKAYKKYEAFLGIE